jgi:hypothetical protein
MVEQIPAMVWNISHGGYMELDRVARSTRDHHQDNDWKKLLARGRAESHCPQHGGGRQRKIFDREGIHVDSQRLIYLPQLYRPPKTVRGGNCDDSITLGTLIDVGSIGSSIAAYEGILFHHPPGTEPRLQSLHLVASWRNYFTTRSQSARLPAASPAGSKDGWLRRHGMHSHAPVGMCFVSTMSMRGGI